MNPLKPPAPPCRIGVVVVVVAPVFVLEVGGVVLEPEDEGVVAADVPLLEV